jgi:hypothetical protein
VIAPAPSYDPWAWLLWGREVAGGELSTAEGPAFKPLPVAVCALLAPLGGAAPEAWVIVARAGAVLAVFLAFALGRRLAGGSVAAGVVAAVAVALCGAFPGYAASGAETGWTIALALGGLAAWRAGHARWALACGVACALLRVEAWPFLLAFGALLWRRRPVDRPLLAACAVAVPALWLVPEWLGSGDVVRSGARARVPNPGQPALADFPALASLGGAVALPLWPLWVGAVAALAVPAARAVLAAGAAWIVLVAVMAQAGFSGEARYALPGAALVSIAAAAGLAAALREAARRSPGAAALSSGGAPIAAALAAAALAIAAAPRIADLSTLRSSQSWQYGLANDLAAAIQTTGGRHAALACGRPYVGDLRGPLLAYHLEVEKKTVAFEPAAPGIVFRSRLNAGDPVEPATGPAFVPVARAARWEVRAAC